MSALVPVKLCHFTFNEVSQRKEKEKKKTNKICGCALAHSSMDLLLQTQSQVNTTPQPEQQWVWEGILKSCARGNIKYGPSSSPAQLSPDSAGSSTRAASWTPQAKFWISSPRGALDSSFPFIPIKNSQFYPIELIPIHMFSGFRAMLILPINRYKFSV